MSVDIDQLRVDVGEALATALAKHERSMVTRWVVVVESIDAADGERGLWQLTPPDMKKWDTLALLLHALDTERADTVADRLRDDDD